MNEHPNAEVRITVRARESWEVRATKVQMEKPRSEWGRAQRGLWAHRASQRDLEGSQGSENSAGTQWKG